MIDEASDVMPTNEVEDQKQKFPKESGPSLIEDDKTEDVERSSSMEAYDNDRAASKDLDDDFPAFEVEDRTQTFPAQKRPTWIDDEKLPTLIDAENGPTSTDAVAEPDEDDIIKAIDADPYQRPPLDITVVPRGEWSKIPTPELKMQFSHPLKFVMISHTGTRGCKDRKECVRKVREIQRHHIALGYPDIIYNFLLGGDGKVYEGRGWKWQGGVVPKYPDSFGECLKIAHIGYYGDNSNEKLSSQKTKLQYDFIETGMEKEYVSYGATMVPDYNE